MEKETGILTANPQNVPTYKKPAFWLVIAGIMIVAVAATAFMSDPQKPFDLENTKAEAMLFATNKTDLLDIGQAACDHYYATFMGENIPQEYRITKYKIHDLSLLAGNEKEFCVQVTSDYSTTGLYFLSANGNFIPNNTGYNCTDDYKEFRITSLGNSKYQIVSMGTGGGGQGLMPADIKTFVEENINIIMSSPQTSSNPHDYIEAHQPEYNAILALDAQALPYLFAEFEKGTQAGLKGHIMERLCREILGKEDIKYANADPQDWYNVFKEHMQGLAAKNSFDFVQKNYPKAAFVLNE